MSTGSLAIQELEQELEATQQRCALIERAINGLREIYGLRDDGADPPALAPRAKKTDRQTDRQSKARASAARSLPDDDVEKMMLAALQKRSPMKPRELAAAAKVSTLTMRQRVKALVKRGTVTVTGSTNSRQVHLGRHAAKEEP